MGQCLRKFLEMREGRPTPEKPLTAPFIGNKLH